MGAGFGPWDEVCVDRHIGPEWLGRLQLCTQCCARSVIIDRTGFQLCHHWTCELRLGALVQVLRRLFCVLRLGVYRLWHVGCGI